MAVEDVRFDLGVCARARACDWIGCEVAWSMDFWVMNEHVGTTKISTQLLRIWTELRKD